MHDRDDLGMLEADAGDRAGRMWPPHVDGTIGEFQIGR
jgi:hypothetical protein